uniref:Uncharacterized protein n=1 Tax=Anguilla anguilla TaxID=7936 RepID=A0A0E9TBQ2_ANGAN
MRSRKDNSQIFKKISSLTRQKVHRTSETSDASSARCLKIRTFRNVKLSRIKISGTLFGSTT